MIKWALLLVVLSACSLPKEEQIPYSPNVPRTHLCNEWRSLHYPVDSDRCYKHFINPKYKIGNVLHFKSKIFSKNYRFKILGPYWNPVTNTPSYHGIIFDKKDPKPSAFIEEDIEEPSLY